MKTNSFTHSMNIHLIFFIYYLVYFIFSSPTNHTDTQAKKSVMSDRFSPKIE